MDFVFLSAGSAPETYITDKLNASLATAAADGGVQEVPPEVVANALEQLERPAPPIASEAEFFETDAKQKKLIEVAQRCAIQELAEGAPLLVGEMIEEDFFSYLTTPWQGYPALTAVLLRTTNRGAVLYIFDRVRVDGGHVFHLPNPQPEHDTVLPPRGGFDISAVAIRKLLKALAGKAASAAVGELGIMALKIVIKEIFGDGDTEQLIAEVRKVVRDEIEAHEVTRIEGAIEGTLLFLQNEYQNLKDRSDLSDPQQRRELIDRLARHADSFYINVIGVLKQERYRTRGLKTFAFGASVHLVLTQEMALVDPNYQDPNDSGYLLTLRDNASTYKKHVEQAHAKAVQDRNRMETFTDTFVDCLNGATCVHKVRHGWRDNVSGERVLGFSDTKNPQRSAAENARDSLEKHRTKVLADLEEKLGKPTENFLPEVEPLTRFRFPKSVG